MWRWLAVARASACVEATPTRRGGFAFTNELWAQLSDLGENVAALDRQLSSQAQGDPADTSRGPLPSLATLHRVVRQEQRVGRVLEIIRPRHGRVDPAVCGRALAELALPGTADEAGSARPCRPPAFS
ncbi:hypothetical protein [Streptomyces sp. NPDC057580]|uniref:hypothetical protein n=1 Tax=Streptomyces sp. NPDC057580 TaxID=3346173 RepID=UPI0036BEE92B